MQVDKKHPVLPEVIEEVSKGIDALVLSVEEGVPYEDIDAMKDYVQWTFDYKCYKEELAKYDDDLKKAEESRKATAHAEFRKQHGMLFQEVRWAWSPIWRLLSAERDLLATLPELPWRHDG